MSISVNKGKELVRCAAALARQLHKGQVDKAGVDYFSGASTIVAKMRQTWQEQVVGYLHDASEDTPNTVDEVLNLLEEKSGISLSAAEREELTVALRLLNHHFAPDRETYIHRIKDNPLATAVKLHDLTHNMDLSRLPNPTEKDYEWVARYKKEYDYLNKI